jgi:hypothetical protein
LISLQSLSGAALLHHRPYPFHSPLFTQMTCHCHGRLGFSVCGKMLYDVANESSR